MTLGEQAPMTLGEQVRQTAHVVASMRALASLTVAQAAEAEAAVLTASRRDAFPNWFETTFAQYVISAALNGQSVAHFGLSSDKSSPQNDRVLLMSLLHERGIPSRVVDLDGWDCVEVALANIP